MRAIGEGLRSGGLDAARAAWLDHDFFAPAQRLPEVARRLAEMVGDYPGLSWTSADPPRTASQEHRAPFNNRHADNRRLRRARRALLPGDVRRSGPTYSRRTQDHRSGAGHMVNMEAPALVNALLRDVVLDRSAA
jgi:hypothetical protein